MRNGGNELRMPVKDSKEVDGDCLVQDIQGALSDGGLNPLKFELAYDGSILRIMPHPDEPNKRKARAFLHAYSDRLNNPMIKQ